jgi:hypothetical protein
MLRTTLLAVVFLVPMSVALAAAPAPQGYSAVGAKPAMPVGGTPEPTTMLLMCGGALAYVACRRYGRPQRRED